MLLDLKLLLPTILSLVPSVPTIVTPVQVEHAKNVELDSDCPTTPVLPNVDSHVKIVQMLTQPTALHVLVDTLSTTKLVSQI